MTQDHATSSLISLLATHKQTHALTDRQTDRQTDKETYRQTGTQVERDKLKTGRPTYRHKDRQVADQGRYPIVRGLVIDLTQGGREADRQNYAQTERPPGNRLR